MPAADSCQLVAIRYLIEARAHSSTGIAVKNIGLLAVGNDDHRDLVPGHQARYCQRRSLPGDKRPRSVLNDHPDSPTWRDCIGNQQASTSAINIEFQFMSGSYIGFGIPLDLNKIAADPLPMTFIQRIIQGPAADKIGQLA